MDLVNSLCPRLMQMVRQLDPLNMLLVVASAETVA